MRQTKLEPVSRVYCDECGDLCKGTVVTVNDKDYCDKKECRTEWDNFMFMDRVISDIKFQPFYDGR